MEVEIGRGKKARQAYGFDDIAIVPSRRTRDPQDVDIGWKLGPHLLELPLLADEREAARLLRDQHVPRSARPLAPAPPRRSRWGRAASTRARRAGWQVASR